MLDQLLENIEAGYTYEDGVYVLSLNCILLGEEAAE